MGDKGSADGNGNGVPQGSCLSNTLFSLLLNDLCNAIEGAEIYMNVDDVAAVITATSHGSAGIKAKLGGEHVVNELAGWFGSNGLALNKDKTCFLAFSLILMRQKHIQ